ncbi:hypothetical protein [Szabonella alba]|uniref:Uncharacterized protein n=1 Tax=Szabonella alba TaxID=2804194 RepID=A0A8K0VDU8_9RHOB|nr:hypothetical protein [Szabonella alba]MBL4917990.1 hypothetical protein [Szabonella alba]
MRGWEAFFANPVYPDPSADYALTDKIRFVSFWDMLQLQASSFLSALTLLACAVGELRMAQEITISGVGSSGPMSLEHRASIVKAIRTIRETSEQHGLKVSHTNACRCHDSSFEILSSSQTIPPAGINQLIFAISSLVQTVVDESRNRMFYALDQGAEIGQQDADGLFGPRVVDAFPDAAFDIAEAGRCLSFNLWTAAVMHTMRAQEIGLKALARYVGVEWSDNWNRVLNEIEARLREVRRSRDGAEAEEWASEAGTYLRFVKNAWRNQSMHSVSRYDAREARDIFASTKSFMTHLAEKLRSDGPAESDAPPADEI